MSPPIAWGRFALFSTALVGGGYALMRIATPSEEEFYNALAPDLKKKVDAVRAQRASSEAMQAKLAASAAADKVVWADSTTTGTKRV